MADDEGETNWRFELDDLEAADENAETAGSAPAEPERPPLEPGSPSLENALFVLLGVLLMVFVFFRVIEIAILGG